MAGECCCFDNIVCLVQLHLSPPAGTTVVALRQESRRTTTTSLPPCSFLSIASINPRVPLSPCFTLSLCLMCVYRCICSSMDLWMLSAHELHSNNQQALSEPYTRTPIGRAIGSRRAKHFAGCHSAPDPNRRPPIELLGARSRGVQQRSETSISEYGISLVWQRQRRQSSTMSRLLLLRRRRRLSWWCRPAHLKILQTAAGPP